MSKAFIFTTDSILAILVSTLIASSALAIAANFEKPLATSNSLEGVSTDFLASLEKNGTLARAVESGSNTELVAALDRLPSSTCVSVQLYEGSAIVLQANRTGCACGNELVASLRTFIARNGSTQREMFARFGGCLE